MNAPQLTVPAPGEVAAQRRAVELRVLEQVTIKAWDWVLFVECGDGWLVEEAWRHLRKGHVCGLSMSSELVDLAFQLRGAPGKVEFKRWDGRRFPCTDQSFDRVISCVPCGWYLQPAAVLREMARVLRPDGDAYLLEPDGAPPEVSQPPQTRDSADLGRLLAEAGFSEAGRTRAPGRQGDPTAPVVIHVRQCSPRSCRS